MAEDNTGGQGAQGNKGSDGNTGGAAVPVVQTKQLNDSEQRIAAFEKERQELVAEARGLREKGRDKDSKIKELEETASKIEAEKLKEQGHYKKLYEETVNKLAEVTTKGQKRFIRAQVRAAVVESGATDPDVARLIDTDDFMGIEDEDELVEAIKDRVARHKEAKPTFYKASDAGNRNAADEHDEDKGEARREVGTRRAAPKPAGKPAQEDVRGLPRVEYEQKKREYLKKLQQGRRY